MVVVIVIVLVAVVDNVDWSSIHLTLLKLDEQYRLDR